MRFSAIVGHEDLKQMLINSVKNEHVAHAQLMHGKEGGAGLAMALAFLTYINCENKQEKDSCGECPSCSKMDKHIHPDVQFIFPSTVTKMHAGDKFESKLFLTQWREILNAHSYFNFNDWMKHLDVENKQGIINVRDGRSILANMALKSFESKYKAAVIWMPEVMNASCSNALLKLLEEPPENTLFFLVSYDYEKLLPTIISRTQQIYIPQFSDNEIVDFFEREKIVASNLDQVVRLAEGNLNLAFKLNDEKDNNLFSFFTQWLRACYAREKPSKIISMADEFHKFGREGQKNLFVYGLKLLRNVLLENLALDALVKLSKDEQQFIKDISKLLSERKLEAIIEILNDTHYYITRNANPKIIFTSQSLKITNVFWTKELTYAN